MRGSTLIFGGGEGSGSPETVFFGGGEGCARRATYFSAALGVHGAGRPSRRGRI